MPPFNQPNAMVPVSVLQALVCLAGLIGAAALPAADIDAAEPAPSRLIDPEDGWLDASGFLDTTYGFIPVVAPITEPAVGYGAVGALVFIDRDTSAKDQKFTRPNIFAVGGMATENGTHGAFAGHLGT